jgi:glyoxylase-like metal-dependent hydrolase (beta-lactamase superfamily II)
MKIKFKPMGAYQTNCYIVEIDSKQVIIDPGIGAVDWVKKNVTKPIAILNTHGHFDHVWSNKELKETLNIPIYVPKEDAFMLENDPFAQGTPPSKPDVLIEGDTEVDLDGFRFKFLHFPGHTPGCSAILIENTLFSGDFIFKDSIGRVDFPYSNPEDMKKSIHKFLAYTENWEIYPGHGNKTSSQAERKNLPTWLQYI